MKRAGISLVGVLLLVGGYMVGSQPWASTVAGEAQGIRVTATSNLANIPGVTYSEGDPCLFGVTDLGAGMQVAGAGLQILVRDESNVIVASQDLIGEVAPGRNFSVCNADMTISVPSASYYTVHAGDRFLRSYGAEQFPLGDDEGIHLLFE